MKMTEKLATNARLGPITRRARISAGRHAGHRRDVARHERQDARRQERDQPGAERHRYANARGRVHASSYLRVPPPRRDPAAAASNPNAGNAPGGPAASGTFAGMATATQHSQNFINGEYVDPGRRSDRAGPQSRHRRGDRPGAAVDAPPTSTARSSAARGRVRRLGDDHPGRARARAAQARRRDRGARRRAGRARVRQRRQADRTPSATTRSRSWSTTCASSPAPRAAWRARAAGEYVSGYTSMIRREPIGVDRADRAVELPADDGRVEDRPGAGRRQHGRAQAGRDDAR